MFDSVSILIPTHNRVTLLIRTLESLSQLTIPSGVNVELIVVANACTDDTESRMQGILPNLPMHARCVSEPEAGLNMARNRAIAEATGEIFAFLDDDVWVDPGWLTGLFEIYRTQPADLIGGRVFLWWEVVQPPRWMFPGMEILLSGYDLGNEIKELTSPSVVGANISFRRRVIESIGLFRPGLDRTGDSLLGGGETEFIQRALASGFRLFYAPRACVKHWVSPHRIGWRYLHRLVFDAGRTEAFMRPDQSRWNWLPPILGQPFGAALSLCGATVSFLKNDRSKSVERKLRAIKRLGIATGAMERFVHRSANLELP